MSIYKIKGDMPRLKYNIISFADTEALIKENGHHDCYCISASNYNVSYDFDQYERQLKAIEEAKKEKKYTNDMSDRQLIVDKDSLTQFHSYSNNCIQAYLSSFKFNDNVLVLIHNLKYDFAYFLPYLTNVRITEKAGSIYAAEGLFNRKHFFFYDTLKVLQIPLAKFNESLQLGEIHKEVFPYQYYNESRTFSEVPDKIEFVSTFLNNAIDKPIFLKNCKSLGMDVYFDRRSYARFYCDLDAYTLAMGYLKFRDKALQGFHIDTLLNLTISSISDLYMYRCGTYDNTMRDSTGNLRLFLQKTLYGGRVMCRKNKPYSLRGKRIAYLDAVSLYPSAMLRLAKEKLGIPVGTPMLISSKIDLLNLIADKKPCFVRINITKVGKKLDLPLLSVKDASNTRVYDNVVYGN